MLLKMIDVSEEAALTEIARRLTLEFPEAEPDTVAAAIQHAYARFIASKIRDFVPLFVERNARRLLSQPALAF